VSMNVPKNALIIPKPNWSEASVSTGSSAGDDAMVGNFPKNTIEKSAFFRVTERENGTMVAQNSSYNTEATCAAFSDSAHGIKGKTLSGEISQNKG
jgi:hypothetical protein